MTVFFKVFSYMFIVLGIMGAAAASALASPWIAAGFMVSAGFITYGLQEFMEIEEELKNED